MFIRVRKPPFSLRLFIGALIFCLLGFPNFASATDIRPDDVAPQQIDPVFSVSFSRVAPNGRIQGVRLGDPAALRQFYDSRENVSFWLDSKGELNERARVLVSALEESWTHGLNPARYHPDEITALLEARFFRKSDQIDILLSDAFVKYAQDLSGMRVDPEVVKQRAEFWRAAPDASSLLSEALAKKDAFASYLRDFAPQDKLYQRLRGELVDLVSQGPEPYLDVLPITFSGYMVFPGNVHKDIRKLRVRFGVSDDPSSGNVTYDEDLVARVMALQKANRLEPDGVIGEKTLQVINTTRETKIRQVVANLERLRWLERDKPARYVLVNLPSQRLWAIENGRVSLEMDVIVGKTWRPSRSFVTEIRGVRVNPDWTVPPTIKSVDMVNKMKKDPNYLTEKGIRILKGYGRNAESIDPASIDWHTVGWRTLNGLRMVMDPGPENPLGRIRLLMPNRYNMYLHDTDKPEYFEKPDRTLSSGCIRMSKPVEMAHFVMKGTEDWSDARLQELLGAGEKTDLRAHARLPVYITYLTMWLDEKGQLVYGIDIYKRDPKLVEALRQAGNVPERIIRNIRTASL